MGVFSRKQDQSEPAFKDGRRSSRRKLATEREEGDDALDPATSHKRRARRRLLGAAALAIGAVIVLPMVFDREPASGGQDISVQIPDQDTPFKPDVATPPVVAPAAPVAAVSATPASTAPSVSTLVPGATSVGGSVTAPPVTASPAAPVARVATRPQEKAVEKAPAKPDHAPAPAPTPAPAPAPAAAAPAHDDPRALAALEGKTVAPISSSGAASTSGSFALQIGAFSSDAKVKELKDKLAGAGLKAYTEPFTTPQGPRTRVRVGPYASRDAVDRARSKVKTLGLDSTVVPL